MGSSGGLSGDGGERCRLLAVIGALRNLSAPKNSRLNADKYCNHPQVDVEELLGSFTLFLQVLESCTVLRTGLYSPVHVLYFE